MHYIQLFFLGADREFKAEHLNPNYSQLFIVDSHIESTFTSRTSPTETDNSTTNSIALFHDSVNDSIRAFLMKDDLNVIDEEIQVNYQRKTLKLKSENVKLRECLVSVTLILIAYL